VIAKVGFAGCGLPFVNQLFDDSSSAERLVVVVWPASIG
jgi:hypothetical protein